MSSMQQYQPGVRFFGANSDLKSHSPTSSWPGQHQQQHQQLYHQQSPHQTGGMEGLMREFLQTTNYEPIVTNSVKSNQVGNCPFLNFCSSYQGGMSSDLIEGVDSFVLKVDIPGTKKDDIDIEIQGHFLSIKASKPSSALGESHACPPSCTCAFALGKSAICTCVENCCSAADSAKEANFLYHFKERADGRFKRTWQIPDNADCSKTLPDYKDGTLTFVFPKITKEPKSCFKKVEIN